MTVLAKQIEPPQIRRETDSEGWRWYAFNDNPSEWYISATKVLDCAIHERLKGSFIKNTQEKQEKKLEETAKIGSRIHEVIEQDLKGLTLSSLEGIEKPFENWLKIKETHKIMAKYSELYLYSDTLGVAGTADIVGEFEGKEVVLDIKTGFFSVKAGWQLAAYRFMAQELGLASKNCGMIGLQIKRDGIVSEPFVFKHYDWCLKSFVACFEIWKALYFTKLNNLNWKWLHKSALEVLWNSK